MRDILNNLSFTKAIATASKTAGENGTTIDLETLQCQEIFFLAVVGVITTADASNYLALTIQTSPDGTTWTTVTDVNSLMSPASLLIDGVTNLSNAIVKFGITRPSQRYIRAVTTKTGTVQIIMGVTAVLGAPRHAPTT